MAFLQKKSKQNQQKFTIKIHSTKTIKIQNCREKKKSGTKERAPGIPREILVVLILEK